MWHLCSPYLPELPGEFDREMTQDELERFVKFKNSDIAIEDVEFMCYSGSIDELLVEGDESCVPV